MIVQVLVDGVVAASFITLGVVGLSMIYNILNFPTFAQGDHIATGAYLALGLVALMGTAGSIAGLSFGWPLILALIGAAVLNGVVALALDKAIFAQLRRQNASRISLIMASFGVALMLRHLIIVFAGHEPQYFSFAIQPALDFGGVRITRNELVSVVVTTVMVIGLHLFLSRTWLGKSMRAVAENPALARVNGIDVNRVILWTWVIGAGLAAVAGVLLGIVVQIHPFMGFELLLPMFAALIVGGMTSIYGAVLGALLIGLAEGITVQYLVPEYRQAVSFIVVIVVLMVRPNGILGEKA
jgi:branched-chain amino acid transport system permease protein